MNESKVYSGWQFAIFRIVLGIYLFWHFAALLPYGPELFSSNGVIGDPSLNFTYRLFPNVLNFATPAVIRAFLLMMLGCAAAFAAGWHRRTVALILWYGWACLFNRNNLISNPGIPYVGLLLLFSALVPQGEPIAITSPRQAGWKMPAAIYFGAWFLLVVGYTYSGSWKLISPSWQNGSALYHLLTNPLARPGLFRDLLLACPPILLRLLTWAALFGELSALPLSLFRKGRLIAWLLMLAMHLSILFVVDFADLTMGMMMIHLFTFDPEWLQPMSARKPIMLFDGDCALCNGAVQFFLQEDTNRVLRYTPLQSRPGRNFLQKHKIVNIDSIVLIENPSTPNERAYTRSTAVLRALVAIGGIWKLMAVTLVIPELLRDGAYDLIGTHRYKWFGRASKCLVPSPELKVNMLESHPT